MAVSLPLERVSGRRVLRWLSAACCGGAALTLLAGCSGSTVGSSPLRELPQASSHEIGPSGAMPTRLRKQSLLYVSDYGNARVYIVSYPAGALKGTLTISEPLYMCADARHVWIVNQYPAYDISEYRHGGTRPIKTLTDTSGESVACAIDPTTPNLAVSNICGLPSCNNDPGTVLVYDSQGNATSYSISGMNFVFFLGYDNKGNLYVDGRPKLNAGFLFAELKKGATKFSRIKLNQTINYPGAVQWDGKYVAVGDQQSSPQTIYQFKITGKTGTKVGSTPLDGPNDVAQFWIDGSTVVGADVTDGVVDYWNYPAGGSPTKILTGFVVPALGVAISPAE